MVRVKNRRENGRGRHKCTLTDQVFNFTYHDPPIRSSKRQYTGSEVRCYKSHEWVSKNVV